MTMVNDYIYRMVSLHFYMYNITHIAAYEVSKIKKKKIMNLFGMKLNESTIAGSSMHHLL